MASAVLTVRAADSARAARSDQWLSALAISTLSPALFALAFPMAGFGPAALVALVPLFLLWSTLSWKRAFLWGWMSGTLTYALLLSWMAGTIFEFVGAFSVLVVALVCAIEGLTFAAVALVASLVGRGKFRTRSIFVLPSVWLLFESARSHGALGLPFGALGHAAAHLRLLLPLAAFGGVYLLSAIIALVNSAIAALIVGDVKTRLAGAGVLTVLIALVALADAGADRAAYPSTTTRVAIAQSDVDQRVKWSPQSFAHALAIYSDLTRQAARQGARVVIWPETAVTAYPRQDPELLHALERLAVTNHVWLITGALDQPTGDRLYNAVLDMTPSGSVGGVYHKHLLIPFVEYLPFDRLLRRFAFLDNASDFVRGTGSELLPAAGYRWGTLICYESAFALFARATVNAGADVIIMAADDAWFGDTKEPYEHADVAVVEAASTGRWIVRSTQSGISEFVDPRGRIVSRLGLHQQGLILHDVGPGVNTFFDRFGAGWLFALAVLIATLGFVRALRVAANGR